MQVPPPPLSVSLLLARGRGLEGSGECQLNSQLPRLARGWNGGMVGWKRVRLPLEAGPDDGWK